MQEPSRQLLRHFTGCLAQAELLELRPEFAIANSGQDKGILVIFWECRKYGQDCSAVSYYRPTFGLRHLASAGAVSVAIRLWRSAPRVETVFQAQGPGSRQRPGAERSRKGTLVVFEELWGKWVTWLLGLGLHDLSA